MVELMVVMGIILVLSSFLLPALGLAKEKGRRTVCVSNLKQLLLVCSLYADENRGLYPPPDADNPGNLIVNGESIFPEYVSDLNLFGCPSSVFFEKDLSFTRNGKQDPECLTDISYIYTGFMITRDEEAYAATQAFVNGFGRQMGYYPSESVDDNIQLEPIGLSGYGNAGSNMISRLNIKNADLVYANPSYAPGKGIPVIGDQLGPNMFYFSHRPLGVNFGYMDGHVEFIRYEQPVGPSTFPISPYMIAFVQDYSPTDLSEIGCK